MAKRATRKSTRNATPKSNRRAPEPVNRRALYILSDSTGNLGRHIVTAILTQFPPDAFRVETRGFLRSESQFREVMEHVRADPGLVFHGLLDHAHKKLVNDACDEIGVGCCDFSGPFVDFVERESGLKPGRNYDLLHS